MAYSESIITTVTGIPALIVSFAGSRGWAVSGSTITPPSGTRSFTISAAINGTNNRQHRVTIVDSADPARTVWTQLPWVNGVSGNPAILTPTKLHLFGNNTPWSPAPWIGIVIECGYNQYRHMFIGSLAKIGAYTGGEVISANGFDSTASGSSGINTFDSVDNHFLFGARNFGNGVATPIETQSGGVNVVHANNANSWRIFEASFSGTARHSYTGNEVFGGHGDGVNDGMVRRGVSDYAGSNILVPVALFVPDSTNFGTDVRFRAIGHPPGVRMIDMRGIAPAQTIDVGGEDWMVFPEFVKNEAQSVPFGTARPDGGVGGYYPTTETSYRLGLAYQTGA